MPYERFAAGKTSAEAEFTAQPLAALPPYGCGVPLAGASAEHFNQGSVAEYELQRSLILCGQGGSGITACGKQVQKSRKRVQENRPQSQKWSQM